jgi:hypothetical protein
MVMTIAKQLEAMWAKADRVDIDEGRLAYFRYHDVMCSIAAAYNVDLPLVIAAFCSLSPNSDYVGNLRSTISVLEGMRAGVPDECITVATYNHCKTRALSYLRGQRLFLGETKGLKITNFYHNVLSPEDSRWVTIDGHMVAIARGQNLTMKEAILKGSREYREIAHHVKAMAFALYMLPHQLQATLWFARKRIFNIKYDPQGSLFHGSTDQWRTLIDVSQLKPYANKGAEPCPKTKAPLHKSGSIKSHLCSKQFFSASLGDPTQ